MAEDAASRTEEATPHRLEEARKDGDVPKSMELAQACALAGTFGAVAMAGGTMAHNLADGLLPFIAHPDTIQLKGAAGQAVAWQVVMAAAPALVTVLGATMLAGIAGNLMQHGVLFTAAKLKPTPGEAVNPAEGFKRLFGIDGLIANFLRSVLKVVLVSAVAWWVLAPHARASSPAWCGWTRPTCSATRPASPATWCSRCWRCWRWARCSTSSGSASASWPACG